MRTTCAYGALPKTYPAHVIRKAYVCFSIDAPVQETYAIPYRLAIEKSIIDTSEDDEQIYVPLEYLEY